MCDWCSYHYSNRTFIQSVRLASGAAEATPHDASPLRSAERLLLLLSAWRHNHRRPVAAGRLLLLSAIDGGLGAGAGGVSGRNWAVCAGQERLSPQPGGVTPGLFHFSDWFSSFLDVSRAESATSASYPGGGDVLADRRRLRSDRA